MSFGKILVLEANTYIESQLKVYIEEKQYQLKTAHSIEEAKEQTKLQKPHLIIMESCLPEAEIIDLIEFFRIKIPKIMVILIAACDNKEKAVKALESDLIYDYLTLPLDGLKLNNAVKRAFEYYKSQLEIEKKEMELMAVDKRLKSIIASTQKLVQCKDIFSTGRLLLEEFSKNMAARGGSLFIRKNNKLVLFHSLDKEEHTPDEIQLPLDSQSIFGKVLQEKTPILINNIEKNKNVKRSGWNGYLNNSLMVFPILDLQYEVIGLLTLHSKENPPFTRQDRELGLILITHAYQAIQKDLYLEKLKNSKKKYRDFVCHLPIGFYRSTADNQSPPLFANKALASLLGYDSLEELLLVPIIDLYVDPADRDKVINALNNSPSISNYEIELKKKNGNGCWVLLTATKVEDDCGNLLYFEGMIQDYNQQKKAQKKIKEQEEYLRTVIHSMPSSLISIDKEHNIKLWNQAAENLFSLSQKKAIGKNWSEIFPMYPLNPKNIDFIISNKKSLKKNKQKINYNQQDMLFNLSFYPVYINSETQVIIQVDNITRQEKLQEIILQIEKMRALGNMAAGVAHEVNNPLSIVLQSTQNIKRKILPKKGEKLTSYGISIDNMKNFLKETNIDTYLNAIEDAGNRAGNIIKDLMSFFPEENSKKTPHKIFTIVEQSIYFFKQTLRTTCKPFPEWSIDKVDQSAEVLGNRTDLEQVFHHLFQNACDAFTGEQSDLIINVYTEKNNDFLDIWVTDNGPGISETLLPHVFNPFYTSTKVGKKGLGLSLSYYIIEEHGGSIIIKSSTEGGVVRIRLPLFINEKV